MLNLTRSELTKLRTTAAPWWTSGLIIAAGALVGFAFGGGQGFWMPASTIILSVGLAISPLVIVQSAMAVATEYRYGIPSVTYRITPARWKVALVKLVASAVLSAGCAFLAEALAFSLADAPRADLGRLPLVAAAVTLLTQGVAWLLRNTAGAVTTVLALQFVLEAVVRMTPGEGIDRYTPFFNVSTFLFNGSWSSLGIVTAWAAVAWVAGVVLLELRDA
ncbi:ABC-2 family transporter protein [Corynebacterium capitovis DSM 44611]|uniref:ABC transporter permease n=1 Tax=Corynebacterium capitovis TaxID=131081 RepID=UPI00037B4F3A|nr:ABC transporter permease [Corynebacterium capitovis]WKD58208.1 ABC-2 family transporter protein [Corynebacterium capitovis DSM 44611]